jgi:hypothetical protein
MKGVIPLGRNFVSWFALCALGLYALVLLNGAFFSAWMSGGPPNPYPAGWALRAKAQLIWALAAGTGAFGAFFLVRRYPLVGKLTWVILGISFVLAITPFIGRELLIDRCLDSGGRWSYAGLQCEH